MIVSVIIPTHNPRTAYLDRVVDALRAQTLDMQHWELVVVDNCSDAPLKQTLDLSWHPNGRIVLEEKLGLTHARLRGINETRGDLIVFVDDDNVLESDFLAAAANIAEKLPWLGVFGGGTEAEFEIPPPKWTQHLWGMLAVRACHQTIWSNDPSHWDAFPIGAGLCLRRQAAQGYADNVVSHALRSSLDRTGNNLISGGDKDMVHNCLHAGYGMGRFKELQLLHLIPRERLEPAYLLRLSEAMGYTETILDYLWPSENKNKPATGLLSLFHAGAFAILREIKIHKYTRAQNHGATRAARFLTEMSQEASGKD